MRFMSNLKGLVKTKENRHTAILLPSVNVGTKNGKKDLAKLRYLFR